jgi:hypothetical protein
MMVVQDQSKNILYCRRDQFGLAQVESLDGKKPGPRFSLIQLINSLNTTIFGS